MEDQKDTDAVTKGATKAAAKAATKGATEAVETSAPSAEPKGAKTGILEKIKAAPKRTKLIAAGVAAVVVVSGGVASYAALQTPDAVVAQAIVSLVTTQNPSYELDLGGNASGLDGTIKLFTYSSDHGTALELKVNGKVVGQDAAATLNVVEDKNGDTYLNLADFSSLAKLITELGYLPAPAVDALTTELTGTWVKISAADLGQQASALGSVGTCLTPAQANQIGADLQSNLRNNFFVTVKKELPKQDGNRVFLLTLSADKLRSFLTSFKATKGFTALQKCEPGLEISDASIKDITQAQIDKAFASAGVTIKLSATGDNKFAKLDFNVKDSSTGQTINLTLKANGSHPEKVVIPTKSISFQQLVTTLYASILGGLTS